MEVGDAVYIVASGLLEATAQNCGWTNAKVIATFPGARLEGAVFRHPFLERDSLGVLADYVTLEQGTGAVHTAPGHGAEDYITGQKYGLPTFCPVDAHGRFYHAEGAAGRLPDAIIGINIWEGEPGGERDSDLCPGPRRRMGMMDGDGHGRMGRMDPAKMEQMVARRAADLKAKLKITPAQESAWTSFTAAMKPPANWQEKAHGPCGTGQTHHARAHRQNAYPACRAHCGDECRHGQA